MLPTKNCGAKLIFFFFFFCCCC
ncbi:unnamed protein product [Spirodela intermedia]|uniref:Uncharacterized protein n=1 Tax=Spirodela intermedia TaxID=51605 RepID=A0A7I8K7R1_SPIIN|nr:unnamed protein product [Spirodela intermedia]